MTAEEGTVDTHTKLLIETLQADLSGAMRALQTCFDAFDRAKGVS